MVLNYFEKGPDGKAFDWFMKHIKSSGLEGDAINISLKRLIEEQRKEPSEAEFFIFTRNGKEAFLLCHWFGTNRYSVARILDLEDCWETAFDEATEWMRNGRKLYSERKGAD